MAEYKNGQAPFPGPNQNDIFGSKWRQGRFFIVELKFIKWKEKQRRECRNGGRNEGWNGPPARSAGQPAWLTSRPPPPLWGGGGGGGSPRRSPRSLFLFHFDVHSNLHFDLHFGISVFDFLFILWTLIQRCRLDIDDFITELFFDRQRRR